MNIKELKEQYKIEIFYGESNEKWYVLPAEMSVIDAIRMVADKAKVSMDKILETRAYVAYNNLFTMTSWEIAPPSATRIVWALTVRE